MVKTTQETKNMNWDKTVEVEDANGVDTMTLREVCEKYAEETTTPKGVKKRYHIRNDRELWTWGESGQCPRRLDEFETAECAENELLKLHYTHLQSLDDGPVIRIRTEPGDLMWMRESEWAWERDRYRCTKTTVRLTVVDRFDEFDGIKCVVVEDRFFRANGSELRRGPEKRSYHVSPYESRGWIVKLPRELQDAVSAVALAVDSGTPIPRVANVVVTKAAREKLKTA